MVVFNSLENNENEMHEPIRESVNILAFKLATVLLLFEILYGTVYYIINLGFIFPFDLHHHLAVIIFILEIFKIILQLFLIIKITLIWINNTYFLTDKHLIIRKGVISIKEEVIHFNNIRSITVNQSLLGKIFHYGGITLKTSASGGFQGDVTLMNIPNPEKYENILKNYF